MGNVTAQPCKTFLCAGSPAVLLLYSWPFAVHRVRKCAL